ncbi:MAG TPA: SGNH/GDSL hydrolase family protein [Nitriliruptorales bacterium]
MPYPRAAPQDRARLPGDTWQAASIPVGVRLEVVGDARAVRIGYRCDTDALGYRGAGAGTAFQSWAGGELVGRAQAAVGEHACEVAIACGQRTIVYLPEGMKPTVTQVSGVDGEVEPAPAQPRWVVYGDSVAEGWIASAPALAWSAIAGRAHDLDHVNLGYAGAARGETASAEQVASLDADVLTVCHGTNCWTRTPHSVEQMRADTDAFLTILRQEHPDTPIVVASPVVRPDAEETPNRLGATLADLRRAMEQHVEQRIAAGDGRLALVRGLELIGPEHLGDGIHPDDEGHRRMAYGIGSAVSAMLGDG